MERVIWDVILLLTGSLFAYGQMLEHSTTSPVKLTSGDRELAKRHKIQCHCDYWRPTNCKYEHGYLLFFNADPLQAALRSHFDDCPDSHSQFCFHGTCRFLIQEETPACVCNPGFVGMRCEHADLLAVVAIKQQQQTMTTLLIMCIIGCILLMLICTLLLQCCRMRAPCGCGQPLSFHPKKPSNVLKRGASCCRSETVV